MFDELYQQVVFDHANSKQRRSTGEQERLENPNLGSYKMYNPICGDQVEFFVHIDPKDGDKLVRVRYAASGCALSQAGASMVAQLVEGKDKVLALEMVEKAQKGIVSDESALSSELGDLVALSGVKEFPMRIKCATLGLHAFKKATEAGEKR